MKKPQKKAQHDAMVPLIAPAANAVVSLPPSTRSLDGYRPLGASRDASDEMFKSWDSV